MKIGDKEVNRKLKINEGISIVATLSLLFFLWNIAVSISAYSKPDEVFSQADKPNAYNVAVGLTILYIPLMKTIHYLRIRKKRHDTKKRE
jgi:hypothetical protein